MNSLFRAHRFLVAILSFVLLMSAALALLRLWPKAPLMSGFSSSTAVYDVNGRLLRLTLSGDQKYRLWTQLKDMSPQLVEAALLHEDQHFFRHPGVNPIALVRGAYRTFIASARRQGGSTITMQVARMKYHIDSRSVSGKLEQIFRALQLEGQYRKEEILEAYLNLVPCGANIEGVGAASLIYFGKRAEKISLPEALALAVIPQSPARRGFGRNVQNTEHDALMRARVALFEQWRTRHPEHSDKTALMHTPLKLKPVESLPFSAPHAVDALLVQRRGEAAPAPEIRSTIELKLQHVVERRIRDYITSQSRIGIRNAAAMLIDYRTMEVKALVGSADFFDASIEGQVNGTFARRSPGSTLKPFVYALGLDQGVLHPLTVLKDAPTSFGPFSPENFDGQFAGPISAKDALIKSRNIPAVYVSSRLAKPTLYEFLRHAGVGQMKSEAHYGLALVLGGGEVTMEELVSLYAMLGNRGTFRPLRYSAGATANPTRSDAVPLLSAEASFITLEMLKDNPRPGDALLATQRIPVAWKTGTSYGFHDAWSVGLFGPYVLAVWIGNFNGEANPAFVGVQAAAPLFFSVIDAIGAEQKDLSAPVYPPPRGLARVEVCVASGDLPNAACLQRSDTWFIPGVSPIRVSSVHRVVAIDKRSGLRACPMLQAQDLRFETFEFWPSDLLKLFREAGMPRRMPPPFAPECSANLVTQDVAGGPRITSPLRGVTYTLRSSALGEQVVTLNAVTDGDVKELFWFVDKAFVGRTTAGAGFAWKPAQPGQFTLRAVDDRGRSDVREIRVAVVQ
jgi:penicillin-binding protein 1C